VTDLQLTWLSTIATVLGTAVLFVALARWSVGGAGAWSIAGGVARGIAGWAAASRDPMPAGSPRAVELPPLGIDELAVASLVHPPVADEGAATEIEDIG
jgi:hypothetical protein